MKTSSQTLFNNIIKIESESANKIVCRASYFCYCSYFYKFDISFSSKEFKMVFLNDYLKHFLNRPKFWQFRSWNDLSYDFTMIFYLYCQMSSILESLFTLEDDYNVQILIQYNLELKQKDKSSFFVLDPVKISSKRRVSARTIRELIENDIRHVKRYGRCLQEPRYARKRSLMKLFSRRW